MDQSNLRANKRLWVLGVSFFLGLQQGFSSELRDFDWLAGEPAYSTPQRKLFPVARNAIKTPASAHHNLFSAPVPHALVTSKQQQQWLRSASLPPSSPPAPRSPGAHPVDGCGSDFPGDIVRGSGHHLFFFPRPPPPTHRSFFHHCHMLRAISGPPSGIR